MTRELECGAACAKAAGSAKKMAKTRAAALMNFCMGFLLHKSGAAGEGWTAP
jgi:hypothetical protein